MRVTEIILIENAEIIQLDEGPRLDALKAAAKKGIKAVGKGAAALGKGALKAAPAVGQAVGSTIGAAAGGLAGGAVRGFKGSKTGQTGYNDETPTSATQKSTSATQSQPTQTKTPQALSFKQIQSAIPMLKPAEQAKLLAVLQKTAKPAANPAVAKPASANPTATKSAPAKPAATPAKTGNYDGATGKPISDKAKADAAFDASPEGKQMDAYVDALAAGTFKGSFQKWKAEQDKKGTANFAVPGTAKPKYSAPLA